VIPRPVNTFATHHAISSTTVAIPNPKNTAPATRPRPPHTSRPTPNTRNTTLPTNANHMQSRTPVQNPPARNR